MTRARPRDELGPRLLEWYRKNGRDLPWRRTRDPYAILVSEIMLQQTRVATVLPYYRAFLERFPTVEALAEAAIDEVLALWSGLGYYRRARSLHEAARQVVSQGGTFPSTAQGLRGLPGIGSYTAAAVASVVFGERVAVVDGNVERVLSRLLALDADPRRKPGRDAILGAATALLDPRAPGDSNQAMMELGATLCAPRQPRCLPCPLHEACEARRRGDPESFPPPRARRATVHLRRLAVIVERDGKVLLFRRPEESEVLAGTWELPSVELGKGSESPARALSRAYGGRWKLGAGAGRVKHHITYRSLAIEVRGGELLASDEVAEGVEAGWFPIAKIPALPTSSLVEKALRAACDAGIVAAPPRGDTAGARRVSGSGSSPGNRRRG